MQQFPLIEATYCSNYNGAYLRVADDDLECHSDPEVKKAAYDCVEEIVNSLADECDDDGYYCGSEDNMETVITTAVKKYFGDAVEVKVEEDSISS